MQVFDDVQPSYEMFKETGVVPVSSTTTESGLWCGLCATIYID